MGHLRVRFVLETALALFVFASAYPLIRIGLSEIPPITLGAVRFLLASLVMVPFVVARQRSTPRKMSRRDLTAIASLAIAQIVIPNALQNIGMEYTTASVSSVLQSTTPVFTLLLSVVVLKEQVAIKDLVGMTLALSGVTLLSTGGDLTNLGGVVLVGNLLQVGVAASYALSGIIGKALLDRHSTLPVVSACFVIGAVVLTVFSVAFERNLWTASLSTPVLVAVLLLSFMYCAALVSWYDVLQQTTAFKLYVLLFTMPVLAVVISVATLHETFTLIDVSFSALTLCGVALTQLKRRNDKSSNS
jgi:drug/metabolite transporter (DMT)-like permease